MVKQIESLSTRLTKAKDTLTDDLKTAKHVLTFKIEETDKFFNEQVEILQGTIERNKGISKENLSRAKDDLLKTIKSESEQLKSVIVKTKDEVTVQREEAQSKFEDKIRKIKEVSAQFFNKYDKKLTGYDDSMKELEKTIEEFAKLLVKPQEVNQARLFAIETRMKETEDFRLKEISFIKDVFKKLIFALEQTEISSTLNPVV